VVTRVTSWSYRDLGSAMMIYTLSLVIIALSLTIPPSQFAVERL